MLLRVLGGLDIRGSDGMEVRGSPLQSKRLALLTYLTLAAPRGFHRREKLLALFWPELDSSHARNALSQALHALRRGVGQNVLVSRGEQEIAIASAALRCDALDLDDAMRQGRLADALELYRGDLLDGVHLSGAASEFEHWLESERTRLKSLALSAAVTLAEREEIDGTLERALAWARRAAVLAPYDENVLRIGVRILVAQGNRAGALDAYDAFERRLREDLDLKPSTDLLALVRNGTWSRTAFKKESIQLTTFASVSEIAATETMPNASLSPSPQSPPGSRFRLSRWAYPIAFVTILIATARTLLLANRDDAGNAGLGATRSAGSPAVDPRSLAVLPLVNLSSDRDLEGDYFSDGITEEITNALAQVPGLRVAARTSSFAFRSRNVPVDVIAQRLRVANVIEGSVRRSGNRMRVTVRLVRADSGYDLWSATYDRAITDVPAVQDDVTRRVVASLGDTLARRGGHNEGTADALAYEAYLKGRHFWNQRTGQALERAAEQFRAAIARDPNFARPYAGLADTYNILAALGFAPGIELFPKARDAATRALGLDSTLAEAHAALGFIYELNDANHVLSERELRRAIELNPNYAPAHQWYDQMMVLAGGGRFEEARREMERARSLDPLSLAIATDWARDAYFARQYDLALARLRASVDVDSNYARTHSYRAIVYVQQRRYDEAIVEFENAIARSGGWLPSRFGQAGLARALALSGRRSEATRILEELARSRRYVSPEALALVHTALGDDDAALDALERAWNERAINQGWLAFDPAWDPLRGNARFVRLLESMNLNPQIPPPRTWVADS